MRVLLNLTSAVALSLFAFAPVSVAHAGPRIPGGSYLDSCFSVSRSGSVLKATCGKVDGTFKKTSLNLADCERRSTISNINGVLSCDETDEHYQMPNGSWAVSCKDWSMRGPLLRATCGKIDGTWIVSTLDVRDCDGPVANRNGELVC
jgi:hypothetical protein